LIAELGLLDSLLQDRARNAISAADLSQIFSAPAPAASAVPSRQSATGPAGKSYPAATEASERKPLPASSSSVILLKDRQSVILDKIRQSGNCRTRDLQAVFPGLSERTLRYDLQRLVEEGKIERGGGGGPASWYRLKDGMESSNVSPDLSL